jgi:hypothetical protein
MLAPVRSKLGTQSLFGRLLYGTWIGTVSLGLLAGSWAAAQPQTTTSPFKVTIKEDKTEVVEPILPVDPAILISPSFAGAMSYGLNTSDGKRLTFSSGSARTNFKINGQVIYPNVTRQVALPPGPRNKPRHGQLSECRQGDLVITQTMEIVPGKAPGRAQPGQKRHMNALLVRYVIENKGNVPVKFGLRVRTDAYNWTTDGPVFAAPTTLPGKIIDGEAIEGKQVPAYIISMQFPNLQNPGHQAYYTMSVGRKWEAPSKFVSTWHAAGDLNGWDVQIMKSNGDSDTVLYWAEKDLKPHGKREIAYAFGTGIATNPENEGKMTTTLGGSLEPMKVFAVTTYVDDPVESQAVTLKLPAGMQLLEGSETQPVPPPSSDNRSIVYWRARVLRPGVFPLRIQSSNGVTETRIITVSKNQGP